MPRRESIPEHDDTRATAIAEPRGHRVRRRIRVNYGLRAPDRADYAENVSEGGLFIATNRVHPVGTRLAVEIRLPEHAVTMTGEVVWAIGAPEHQRASLMCGMGIQFVDPPPRWFSAFRRWRRELARPA